MESSKAARKLACGVFPCRLLVVPWIFLLLLLVFYNLRSSPRLVHTLRVAGPTAGGVQEAPARNIAFIKTHKTGGTTLMNILYRYGDYNNLTFVFRRGRGDLGYPKKFRAKMVPKLKPGLEYNMFCRHTRYDRQAIRAVMPNNTVYITVLRHPVGNVASRFDFFGYAKKLKLDKEENPFRYFLDRVDSQFYSHVHENMLLRNNLLSELGMEVNETLDEEKVDRLISQLDEELDLVLLTEHYDESLILLKRLLRWRLQDLVYFKMWARRKGRKPLTEQQKETIMSLNAMDVKLYEHFNRTLWRKIRAQGESFWTELAEFRRLNSEMQSNCLFKQRSIELLLSRSTHSKVFQFQYPVRFDAVNRTHCRRIAANPWSYTSYLMNKQLSRRVYANPKVYHGFVPRVWKNYSSWRPRERIDSEIATFLRKMFLADPDFLLSPNISAKLCGKNQECHHVMLRYMRSSNPRGLAVSIDSRIQVPHYVSARKRYNRTDLTRKRPEA